MSTPTPAPRGFTQLCRALGQRLADAAASVISTAVSRTRLQTEVTAAREAVELDVLTGLGNRAAWERMLDDAQADTRAGIGVGVFDLDGLKSANDTFGHDVGDELLRRFARIVGRAWPGGRAVRLGGDEFGVLIPGTSTDLDQCLSGIRQMIALDRTRPRLSAGIGGWWNPPGEDIRACVRRADRVMYDDKRAARVPLVPSQRRRSAVGSSDQRIEEDLRSLLGADATTAAANGFSVAFQPIFGRDKARVTGVEALARWNHPEFGVIPPDTFVAIAERRGWVTMLDRAVLEHSLSCHQKWLHHAPDLRLSVNVSALHLDEADLADHILGSVAAWNIPAHLLTVEVTETAIAGDAARAARALQRLRLNGVHISIDDFGTGWSSLHRLSVFPVDELKIDRYFVATAERGRGRNLLRAAIEVGHGLGAVVCVEGIETKRQFDLSVDAGADVLQGFLLGRPNTPELIAELLLREHLSDAPA